MAAAEGSSNPSSRNRRTLLVYASPEMALSIKQLNGDASFLLTFEPIDTSDVALSTQPFHVLLDPWITSSGAGIHTNFWSTAHAQEACISSLQDLPEIDLVVVSSAKSDHCNEATLRQLPAGGSKTRILAEPAAARRIRSWRYFDNGTVEALPRWEDGKHLTADKEPVMRFPILPQVFGGEPGEITVAYIGGKRDGHSAIGITYRPPTVSPTVFRRNKTPSRGESPIPPCPPRLPTPALSFSDSSVPASPASPVFSDGDGSPPVLPPPPSSFRRRAGLIKSSPAWRSSHALSPHSRDRGVSVVFSPHGIPYSTLHNYATTHLMSQAVLPLTALLHCFDSYSQPWFLGANNSSGMPMGQETATALGAKAWISTHDGDKDVRGIVSKLVKRRRYMADEVQQTLDRTYAMSSPGLGSHSPGSLLRRTVGCHSTDVMALQVGEEIAMTSEGVWEEDTLFADPKSLDIQGLGLDMSDDAEDGILTGVSPPPWISTDSNF